MNKKIRHSWEKHTGLLSICKVCGIFRKARYHTDRGFHRIEVTYESATGANVYLSAPSCLERFKQLEIKL